jgi:DNA-binding MarR family transcriptional regulator
MSALSTRVASRVELAPWVSLLRAHAALTRELNADLVAEHGLTINDYEVLLRLAHAEGRRMRRVDLAESVFLTPSGITRLLAGLERVGYVGRARCASDARVTYAELRDKGLAKLREASSTHLSGIRRRVLARFDAQERATLVELLGRLAETDRVDCAPD